MTRTLRLLALLAWICPLHVLSARSEGSCCQNGWLAYEGSCYLFADEISLDWPEATHFCQSHDKVNAVIVDTHGEEMMLRDQARRLFKQGRDQTFFWIGATDDEIEGEWTWYTTKDRVSDGYNNWYPGQPETGDSNNQDCACLWGALDFTWHDYHCERKGHVVCEKNLTADSASVNIIG